MPSAPPATVGYFCSTLATTGPGAGRDAADRTRAEAIGFLERHARHFWPNAVDPATGGFRWDYLCADTDVRRPRPLRHPVLDREHRSLRPLRAGPAGHRRLPAAARTRAVTRNLVLAGDWTDCGINAGCIEAAAVSGLQAANALLGRPRWDRISGLFLR